MRRNVEASLSSAVAFLSNDRRKAIYSVSLRMNTKVKLNPGRLYTDKAKPPKEPRILRAEHELREQGAGRQD
eukprot:4073362-Pleurochrysis_carterae.AAC.1